MLSSVECKLAVLMSRFLPFQEELFQFLHHLGEVLWDGRELVVGQIKEFEAGTLHQGV